MHSHVAKTAPQSFIGSEGFRFAELVDSVRFGEI